MKGIFIKYAAKLYLKHYVIGLCHADIRDIIERRRFDSDIQWLQLSSIDHSHADPFLLESNNGHVKLLIEEFTLDDFYGKISLVTLDQSFKKVYQETLIDNKSHLSYPMIFRENGEYFVFPESSQNKKLECYKYDPQNESLRFVSVILGLPLLDSTVLKYNGKYWIFGTISGKGSNSKLYIFFSESLFGPYIPHPGNPVKDTLNGSRPAGNFFEINGNLFRPSQNCEKEYGESITINKVNVLNELQFDEEPYFSIAPKKEDRDVNRIFTMHTFNVLNDIIVVDGLRWSFSLRHQWKYFLKNRDYARRLKKLNADESTVFP